MEEKTIHVIVSHDVDHLFAADHWFRDLIYPKMWVRTTLQLLKREIKVSEWWLRNTSCFRKNRHKIDDIMAFDTSLGIPSVFFFGMNQGLGMSYTPVEAEPIIRHVHDCGFAVGVHGISYQNINEMKMEYATFCDTMGFAPSGIRMHYVRYDANTFDNLSRIGYHYDTTEFHKQESKTVKAPYKVNGMWEFPLTIMDGYLPQKLNAAQEKTLQILAECKAAGLEYITILFHDYQFCDDYLDIRDWYMWLMRYFYESPEFEFISYEQAVRRLEEKQ